MAAASTSSRSASTSSPNRKPLVRAEISAGLEVADDAIGMGFGIAEGGVEAEVRVERRLIGRVDAGEMLDLAGAGLLVEALRIALFGDRQRSVDMDLDELAGADQLASHVALGAEGRDERHQHNEA